jgi:hypothetical protein
LKSGKGKIKKSFRNRDFTAAIDVSSCQLCGAGFDRKPKLEDHLASCHNKITEERRPTPPEPSWHHLVFGPGNKISEERRPIVPDPLCHHLVFDPGNKMADEQERRPAAPETSCHHLAFDPGNKILPADTAARLGLLQ